MKVEFRQADERLDPRRIRIRIHPSVNLQPSPGYLEPSENGNIEPIEFNFALKTIRQRLNHPRAQNRLGPVDDYPDDRRGQKNYSCDDADDLPAPRLPYRLCGGVVQNRHLLIKVATARYRQYRISFRLAPR